MATAIKPEVGWIKREALQCIFEQTPENSKGRRDKIIMMLMYETAARASEILDLKISSLNLFDSGSSVRLHGKGNKTREIPVGKKITHLLNQYLDEYHKKKDPKGYLFFTLIHKRKNRMSIGNLERIVRKYSKLAREVDETVPIRVVPHMFRHSRATHMLSKNTPMVIIARFLGHVNLDSTSVYASCNVEMLREAIGKVEKDEPIMQEEATWEIDENQLAILCGLE
jgi:site-specific recombinase XerD